jgi:rRNA maturation endonuclease Nob1
MHRGVRAAAALAMLAVRLTLALGPWRGSRGVPSQRGYVYECPKGHQKQFSEKPAGRQNCPKCGKQLRYVGRG